MNRPLIRKKIIVLVNFISPLIPKHILSDRLACANYEKGRYELASRRIKGNGILALKIKYKLANNDLNTLADYFNNNHSAIEDYFYKLPYELIYDYLRFMQNSIDKLAPILTKIEKNPNRMRAIFVHLAQGYLGGYLPTLSKACEVNKVLRIIILLEKNIRRTTGKRAIIIKGDFFNSMMRSFNIQSADFLSYIQQYSGKDKAKIIVNFIKTYPEQYARDVLSENFVYLKAHLGKNKLLNIIKSTNEPELYIKFYPQLLDYKVSSYINWLFYKKKYDSVKALVVWSSRFGLYTCFDKCLYLMYLSLIESDPRFAIDYFERRNRKQLNVSSYLVLNSLYLGDLRKAETERTRIASSLQNYINRTYGEVTLSAIGKAKHCLIIAEQGVADEIRWARLYSQINNTDSKKYTITCDPRFYTLLSSAHPNLTFIPHCRLFRKGPGMGMDMFHSLNIPDEINDFDLIMSTSMLFNFCEDIKTNNLAYISPSKFKEPIKGNRVKIGLLWSSSLAVGLRKERYGIPNQVYHEFINRIRSFDCSVYCLQSPLSKDDIGFCKENNILIDETVDLYNDFDGSAKFLSSLDYVVGPSSLLTELAAACGTTFLHIANAPEISLMRNGNVNKLSQHDQLSNNTITVYPKVGYIESKENINRSCLDHVFEIIKEEISQ